MKTIIGVFDDRENAQFAITCLKKAGFHLKDMSIVMKDPTVRQQIADETGVSVGNAAVTGLTTGAVVGGLAGLLIGIGAIAIPGIGAVLIAGPLAAAFGLTGAAAATASGAVTGAVAGGLLGALMGLGLPKEQAQTYEKKVQEGAILLAVPAMDERENEVKEILADHEATDLTSVIVPIDEKWNYDEEEQYTSQYEEPAYQYANRPQSHYASVGVKGGKRVHTTKHMQEIHTQNDYENTPAKKRVTEVQPEIDIQ